MELEITPRRALRIWWSFAWRSAIATLATIMVSMVIGFFLGMVLALVHVAPTMIRLIAMPVGFVIGLIISFFPLRMILGKDFGEFRLVLVAREPAPPAGTQAQVPGTPPRLPPIVTMPPPITVAPEIASAPTVGPDSELLPPA